MANKNLIKLTITVLIGFLCGSVNTLNCYKCIALDCPHEQSICKSMEKFVLKQMYNFYFIEDDLPICPPPDDKNPEWEKLKSTSPTKYPCKGDQQKKEATCSLGRFQIATLTTENGLNYTSHGTIMGCAKPDLLKEIRISKDQIEGAGEGASSYGGQPMPFDDEPDRVSIVMQKPCHLDKRQSHIELSLQHFMELEHCSIASDMCHNHDYCVMPKESVVKPFVDSSYDNNRDLRTVTNVFIWVFVIVALIVIVLTFLGIKYDT